MGDVVLLPELIPNNIDFYLTCKTYARYLDHIHRLWFRKPVLYTEKEEIVNHIAKFINLTHLTVKGNFSKPFDVFPATLTYLDLKNYNHPLPNIPSLLSLLLGHSYNEPLPAFPLLENLTLGFEYNVPLPSMPSLKTLWLGDKYNQALPNTPSLEMLSLGYEFYHPSINHISASVRVGTGRVRVLF